ncbi:MAG: 8-amino-7-oxononanoate synthase [Eubacterium sp.]|jgi:8-amino-7-oxononanoate synthase|nr:8-amino-7-oxononanoate synthase [Eubacterium sp.]
MGLSFYSVKMRASEQGKHISGAERLVLEREVDVCVEQMLGRGRNHSKGKADLLNIKMEKIEENEILYLDTLPVSTVEVKDFRDGLKEVRNCLLELGIVNVEGILGRLPETYAMRGAMLLDVDTLKRLEPDRERGVRATYMDGVRTGEAVFTKGKHHFQEAVVLAAKVANAPNIIGEICISDDPDYVAGYVASKVFGYRRITKVKEAGSELGGRIFLYRGREEDVAETVGFLEHQAVLVRNAPELFSRNHSEGKFGFLNEELKRLREDFLFRSMKTMQSAQSSSVLCDGRRVLLLASNHYLDLARRKDVKESAERALDLYGTGSGGSRLTTGNTVLHEKLESRIAEFKGEESALLFNSGYVANLAAISALMGKGDVIFSDELNHASIIDGCRLSGAEIVIYRHNDMRDLEQKLAKCPFRRGLVVSDAVFSMDGDILNLPEFAQLADRHQALSMVDEAHSTGVIGRTGRGIVEHYHGVCRPDILMGTLSKAIGSEGGFVCGSRALTEFLRHKARGFVFSTSLSPAVAAASIQALEALEENPQLVLRLRENVLFFCGCLREGGILADSKSAVIPIMIGDEKKAIEISEELFSEGYFIPAIRYPTVKRGSARLRAALMSEHSKKDLREAAEAILRVCGKYGIV